MCCSVPGYVSLGGRSEIWGKLHVPRYAPTYLLTYIYQDMMSAAIITRHLQQQEQSQLQLSPIPRV